MCICGIDYIRRSREIPKQLAGWIEMPVLWHGERRERLASKGQESAEFSDETWRMRLGGSTGVSVPEFYWAEQECFFRKGISGSNLCGPFQSVLLRSSARIHQGRKPPGKAFRSPRSLIWVTIGSICRQWQVAGDDYFLDVIHGQNICVV
jgi:hypothetical protein